MKIKARLLQQVKNLKECENLWEWIVIIAVLTFSMFTMFYADFQGTMDYAYQVTRKVFCGDFGSVKYMAAHSYGMTMFLLLFLWMIPFYFCTIPFGNEFWYYGSVAGAAWSKLFLVVVTAFLIKAVLELGKQLPVKENNRKWIPLFLLTSMFYYIPVIQIGQCDIIALTFVMWGLVYYLKGDLKKFLFCFAFAIPMKYFALMIFVPLVLLHEKNPIKIIVQGICGGSLFGINLLIRQNVWGTVVGSFTSEALSNMASTSNSAGVLEEVAENATILIESNAVEGFFGPFVANSSLFVMCYILICVLAYAIPYNKEMHRWVMYIPLLVFSAFFMLTDVNVYWLVLLMPFMTMVIFSNTMQLRLSMLLETIAGGAMTFIYIFKVPWVVGGELTFDYLFLKGRTVGSNVETFIHQEYDLSNLLPYAYSAYVACMLGIILINIPGLVKKQNSVEVDEKFDRWIIWFRTGILYAWTLLLVFVLLLHD